MPVTRREPLPGGFKLCLLLSAILHAGLIVWGSYQDARSAVKYTDIDYVVFSDAARFVWAGLTREDVAAADRPGRTFGLLGGWLGRYVGISPLVTSSCNAECSSLGSPYDRSTYRYTPLLALMLTPNEAIHPAFGKILFSACDLIVGYLLFLLFPIAGKRDGLSATKWVAAIWLLNPLPLNIATRGSSESVLGALLLLSLYNFCRTPRRRSASGGLLSRSEVVGSILLGLAVHVKIYPVVFAFSLLGYFGRGSPTLLGRLGLTPKGVAFGLISGGTFVGVTALCYAVCVSRTANC
jgi:phosphatidylinositol glycan class M